MEAVVKTLPLMQDVLTAIVNAAPTHDAILARLLADVQEVNFYKLNGDKPPKQRDYVVLVIEEFLDLAAAKGWNLRYKDKQVYLYNNEYWKPLADDLLKHFLSQAAVKMGVPYNEAQHHRAQNELLQQFYATAYQPPRQKGKAETLINLLNGTFVINEQGQELRGFNAADELTHQLPFEYDPAADCPLFKAHMSKVLPDKEKQAVIQEFLGSIFIPKEKMKLEKALVFYGTGANGKSVCVDVFRAMLGEENVSGFSINSLLGGNSYSLPMLQDKLINFAPEFAGSIEQPDRFKSLVTGEPLEARRIFREPFMMSNYARLAFNCNLLPKNAEQTDGFFRRFLIIEFDVTIPEHERDLGLAQKIIDAELAGVFNWMLGGLRRLLHKGKLSPCAAATKATNDYKTESDNVLAWLEDAGYTPGIDTSKPLKEMFDAYRIFCTDNGYRAVSNKNFSKRLQAAGFEIERKMIGLVVFLSKPF